MLYPSINANPEQPESYKLKKNYRFGRTLGTGQPSYKSSDIDPVSS
jgi:hypothetical protein